MTIILSVIWAIIIFSVIIFVHELGHFVAAKAFRVKVHEFALGMGPKLVSKRKGDTLYSLRAIPMGGFCQMEGEDTSSEEEGSLSNKKPYQKFIILFAGAFMNIVLGFLLLVISTAVFMPSVSTMYVEYTTADYGAARAGIMPNDKIISINGNRVYTYTDIALATYKKESVPVVVERNNEKLTFAVSVNQENYKLGIKNKEENKNFFNVISAAYYESFSIIKLTYSSVFGMFSGKVSVNDMSGPVGIVSEIGKASARGVYDVLMMAILITLNLGVVNLLPIPALDGGRIIFVLFEMITRKKMKPEYEGYIHLAGFALLILFMLYITKNDVMRFFGWL